MDSSADSPCFAKRRTRWALITAILLVHCALLAWGSSRHSPNVDEVGHLAAGVSHWHFGRFELFKVNPPLVRMVAAVPVVASSPQTDWRGWWDNAPHTRFELRVGQDFMSCNGERAFWYFTTARWACIPFSLLGAYVCLRWARELYGERCGLMALTLWCFSPNILAHGQSITPDLGAAALGVAAHWLFWRWLKDPQWDRAMLAGIVLGLAQLTKTTWIILFVFWPVMWLIDRIWHPADEWSRRAIIRHAGQLSFVLLVAVWCINTGYGFEGSFNQLHSYQFVSKALTGGAGSNRFAGSWLGHVPVPLPSNYVQGIDLQKSYYDGPMAGRPSYLRGEWRDHGWWYYYLYALAIKEPVGTWLLLLAGVFRLRGRCGSHPWRDELVLLLPAAVVLVLVSSYTTFNRHLRYVLPILPFAFVYISQVAGAPRVLSEKETDCAKVPVPTPANSQSPWFVRLLTFFRTGSVLFSGCASRSKHVWGGWLVSMALVWSVASSLAVYPHSLSYFNELVGGPKHGHKHLLGSNVDWGQDLLYLKRWFDRHPQARPLGLAYYGGFDPRLAGLEFSLPPMGSADQPPPDGLQPGWYAVSVNLLVGYPWSVRDGQGNSRSSRLHAYSYFQRFRPVASAGYSIYIYHITQQDLHIPHQGKDSDNAGANSDAPRQLSAKQVSAETKVFAKYGGWCWFQDPRAIIADGELIMGSVAGSGSEAGDVQVSVFDLNSNNDLGTVGLHNSFEVDGRGGHSPQ